MKLKEKKNSIILKDRKKIAIQRMKIKIIIASIINK
jgi:hypothetical protein